MNSIFTMKPKIFFLSLGAIEDLPPLQSMLSDPRWNNNNCAVFAGLCRKQKSKKRFDVSGMKLLRFATANSKYGVINLINKLLFSLCAFFSLIKFKPYIIFYFDSDSALSVFLYKKLVNKKIKIFAHYYEYITPEEYHNSRWVKITHRLEQMMYSDFKWISQCNELRMRAFAEENNLPAKICNVIHNYPPEIWQKYNQTISKRNEPLKVIYVGSFSVKTMFSREFAMFVKKQNGRVIWTVYCFNTDNETKKFFNELNCPFIKIHWERVPYDSLPGIYSKFDVGIIMYRGHIKNYIYAESNKLYEYLTCGLDVWFPYQMKSVHPMITHGTYPKIIMLDFEKYNEWDLEQLTSRDGLEYKKYCVTAESAIDNLFDLLDRESCG